MDYAFILPGIPPVTPLADMDYTSGKAIMFKIGPLSPAQEVVLFLTRKQNKDGHPSREDLAIQITCSNCTGLAGEE